MVFWIILFCAVFLGTLISYCMSDVHQRMYLCLLVLTNTGIAVFRNNIGLDYLEYKTLYELVTIEDSVPELEPFFVIVCNALRNIGFEAQAMFAIYAIATTIFMYFGIKYWTKQNIQAIILCFSFYYINSLFWFGSLNLIRQFLAISILFWGSRFVIEEKLKSFFGVLLCAVMCHYSAIIGLLFLVIEKIKFQKKYWLFIILLCIVCSGEGLILWALNIFIQLFGDVLGRFQYYISDASYLNMSLLRGGSGLGLLCYMVFYVLVGYVTDIKDRKQRFMFNCMCVGLLIWISTYFCSPILRLRIYFLIFICPLLALNIYKLYLRNLVVLIVAGMLMIAPSLNNIRSIESATSRGNHNTNRNIEYKVTFEFWRGT